MTRENVRARLAHLEEELGTARRTGVLRFPDDLELDSPKGKAWLNAHLPEWPVFLATVPAKVANVWLRRFAPRDDALS